MNKTYKVLFNCVRGVATAVSEIASSHQARKKATAVAVAVAMGVMAGSAMAVNIKIDSNGMVIPNNYSATSYVGADGKASLASDVNKIYTESGGVAHTVYGIQVTNSSAVSATSISGGIDLKATGTNNHAFGISFESSGASTLGTGSTTGVGNIAVQSECSAYGIYTFTYPSKGNNTVLFTSGSSITAKSSGSGISHGSYGISLATGSNYIGINSSKVTGKLTTVISEAERIATGVSASKSDNTIAFSGSGSSIAAKGYYAQGISCSDTGKTTITDLGSITATASGSVAVAYGIRNASPDGDAETNHDLSVSFTGDASSPKQAITATNTANPANAYSIYAADQGTTTVCFENSILSGKIHQEDKDASNGKKHALTLNFNQGGVWTPTTGDLEGKDASTPATVTVNINNGGVAKFENGALTATGTTLTFAGNSTIVLGKDVSVKKIEGTAGALVWKSGSLTPSEGTLSAKTLAVIGSGKTLSTPISGVTNYLFAVDSAATSPQNSMLSVAGDVTLGNDDKVGVTLAKGAKFKKDDTIKLISVTSGSLQDSRNDKSNLATTIQSNLADNNTAAAQAIAASTEASNKVNRYTFDIAKNNNDLLATVTKVAASNVTKAVRQVNDSTVISFRSQMNDVSRRMGELRGNPEGYGAWARVYGGQTTMGEGMKEKSVTLQVGGDKWFSSNFYAGMMAAYTKADDTLANGDNDQKNWNIGLYGGYFGEDGRFWDATVKFGRFGNDFNLMHEDSEVSHAKYHTWGQSFSLEGGWRLQCPSTNFYVEPQAEIMYGHLNGVSFTDNLGITTSQKKVDTFVGRLGVAAGYNFANDKGTAYVKASILHDSQGKVESECRIDGEVDQDAGKSRDLGGTWGEFALGGTFKATKNLNLYGELMCTTKAAGVRTKWQGSAGVRYTF